MRPHLAVGLCLVFACKKDEPEAPPDAGPDPTEVSFPDQGFALTLLPTWIPGEVPKSQTEVKILLDARRAPVGRPYLVAPRLVITVEPTGSDHPRRSAERALDDLQELEHKKQLRLTRKVTGERRYGEELAVDLEVAYEVQAPGAPVFREIVQRSLFVFRRLPDGSRAIVTLTATFLAEDAALLLPETEQTWSGLRLTDPGAADVDAGMAGKGPSP